MDSLREHRAIRILYSSPIANCVDSILTEAPDCLTVLPLEVSLRSSARMGADRSPLVGSVVGVIVEVSESCCATSFRACGVGFADPRGDNTVCRGDCPKEGALLKARFRSSSR
jgi:hypothetical protein